MLAGLPSISLTILDLDDLAEEALDPSALAEILRSGRLEAAAERSYAAPGPRIRRIEVRVVRFATVEGAEDYLTWQLGHVAELIGDVDVVDARLPGVTRYVHEPEGCCAKEPVITIATWRRGVDVVRVLLAGPGADDRVAAELLEQLHRSLGSSAP